MKINEIKYNKIAVLKTNNTQNQVFQNKQIQTIEISNTKAPNNPKYYQAINNVFFAGKVDYSSMALMDNKGNTRSLKLKFPLENDESITLNLNKDEIKPFLSQDGQIDKEILDVFAELYCDYYKTAKKTYEKERKFLLSVLNKELKSKTRSLNPRQEMARAFIESKNAPATEYLEHLLSNINDDDNKINTALYHLKINDELYRGSSIKCAQEALGIIRLSKANGEFDISNLDKKRDISVIMTFLTNESDNDCLEIAIENSKDEDGIFDVAFCSLLAKAILKIGYCEEPTTQIITMAKMLKTLEKKDPTTSIYAINCLLDCIDKGGIAPEKYDEDFECFMQCYNPKTNYFDTLAYAHFDQLLKAIGEEHISQGISESDIEWGEYVKNYRNPALYLIQTYFEEARDENGKIKKDFMSPEEYVKQNIPRKPKLTLV